jgi:2,3-bisphosphoglycerate-independent phosphoglycerate mutase
MAGKQSLGEVGGPAILVVLDGLGDLPHPATGGLSPVEAAATPNLDRLLATGESGELSILGEGVAPESDAGVFALLGYDPVVDSPGRGVLEAMGSGVPLVPGDVALRLNFATCDAAGMVVDSRVGRSLSTREASELATALTDADLLADEGIAASVRSTVGHRGVLWLHPRTGGALSPNVSNADPFYEKVGGMGRAVRPANPKVEPVRPLDDTPQALRTASALNDFLARAAPVLAGHSVNGRRAISGKKVGNALLVRNAGALTPGRPPLFENKWGRSGTAITEMPVERGIARVLGLRDVFVGPMTGDRDAGYRARAESVLHESEGSAFVYVHLKGPDEPAHDGDALTKKSVVEAIDRSFFGPLVDALDLRTVRLCVTADHSTPCVLSGHSDDPVPWVLAGRGIPPEPSAAGKFGSRVAADRSTHLSKASDVIPAILSP